MNFVEVTLTKSDGLRIPLFTPLVHIIDILSSIPLIPFGLFFNKKN